MKVLSKQKLRRWISSEAEANLASQANEMDVDPKSLAGGNRQIRAEQETAGQETEAETEGMETEKFPPDRSTQWSVRRSALHPHRNSSGGSRQSAHGLQHGFYRVFCNAGSV